LCPPRCWVNKSLIVQSLSMATRSIFKCSVTAYRETCQNISTSCFFFLPF
jgi:hypothetical protein